MNMNRYGRAWLSSFRLQTLPVAVSTILIANALAYWQGDFSFTIFLLTLLTAVLLQIVSNLANDYGDFVKNTDTVDRIGPKRAIQEGLITLSQLKFILFITVIIAIVSGIWLLLVATENAEEFYFFLALGGAAIVAAITYTIGKKPYGYIGLGDLSVLIFFGFVGVLGGYYLQTNQIGIWLVLPAMASGFLSIGILNINNMRDYRQDKKAGKNTLVVKMGLSWAKAYQVNLLLTSLGFLIIFSVSYLPLTALWIFIALVPLYLRQIYDLTMTDIAVGDLLLPMIKLNVFTALLLSAALVISI